ncbi:unnamed protein product [Chondrus crispus]|uniref:Uncharacterized protein n=1 Tax=Chondrus crispus TaxID=2769 RepID=R7Q8H3_CHOCR|nr:unnamed protein product [Chondrus crispus]CDF33780.1 unnamed protein product [Chondrus crispus]|eukprot:XP_005713599.1 unnamed protein product [Chondrus crispus]
MQSVNEDPIIPPAQIPVSATSANCAGHPIQNKPPKYASHSQKVATASSLYCCNTAVKHMQYSSPGQRSYCTRSACSCGQVGRGYERF